ncbi:hypothetical protein HK100_007539 [Physocladia obscura]|uniref:Importin N-terminal domain-containing protein n=1 Tax=Physocladia obscura TaxID=109957 RepID=A0AAD5XI87_9FUNG|nr:hypothetical protein HK100_007539 [Physocladia obscura]
MDATQVGQLTQLFAHSLSADAVQRTTGEAGLKNAERVDGVLEALMRIVSDETVDANVRKTAAIFFKNRVQKGWRDPADATADTSIVLVGPHDRDFVRTHIVSALPAVPTELGVFLVSALERILQKDYAQWPNFLPSVVAQIDSPASSPAVVFGSLQALHALAKSLYHVEEPAQHYGALIAASFASLHRIALTLLPLSTPDAAAMLRMIVKVYMKTIARELSPALQDSSSLVPWGTLFVNIIEKDLSFLNDQIQNEDEREKHQWWKAKKWAFRCLHMYLMRYCSRGSEKEYAQFSTMFIHHFAPGIATAYLGLVNKCVSGMWITRHARQQLSTFLADCVKYKTTWTVMKPHTGALITQYIYPQLCFNQLDAELWANDSIEYVQRKMGDYSYEERVNPVEAAEFLLHAIVTKRFSQVFTSVMQFVVQILQGTSADSMSDEASARRKSGAIRMVLGISDTVMDQKKSPYHNQMDAFFVQHIFPEFKSRFGFMRAMRYRLTNAGFNQVSNNCQQQQRFILESVLAGVQDPELPVKVYAAQTISLLIEYKSVFEALKPYAPALMQTLLTLTSEIDMDTLTQGMEKLATYFPDELAPFSVQLCTQMRDSFVSLVQDIKAAGEDDFEKTLSPLETASGILKAICSVISAVENAPQILAELDNLLAPVIVEVLKSDFSAMIGNRPFLSLNSDLITECMDVIETLVQCSKTVTLIDWQVWGELFRAFSRESIVFVEDIVSSVDSFIRYGTDYILANPNIANEIMQMVTKILQPENDNIEDEDRSFGCMIAESLLLNLRGHCEPFIPQLIIIALKYLKHEDDLQSIFKVHILELVINCLYHSPLQTLQLLEASGATSTFFFVWFKDLENFSRVHDKKLSILALTAVLSLPVQNIPSLQNHVGTLLTNLLKLFQEYPEVLEARQAYLKQINGDEDGDENDDETDEAHAVSEEAGDEDGDASDDDDDYVKFMGENKDFDYDDFVDMGLEEDPYFETPLDDVDPYIEFARFLKQCPADHVLLTAVNVEQHAFLQNIVATAEANQRKLEEEAKNNIAKQ